MKCPRCQHENTPQAKFCEECAAPLARICPICGTQPTAKFCPECAHPVATGRVTEAGLASPKGYTPKHLAEKILTARSALEGERKQVTVLFCDIVDSSRLAERLDPEAMHEIMDRALRLMAEAVHRYEGTVEEAGDKWIKALALRTLAEAVSRLDPSNRQEAERAVLEAIQIQREIGANPELGRTYASYARLLQAWGEKQRATETLTHAIGMFQEMGMAWDLQRAEQALREV